MIVKRRYIIHIITCLLFAFNANAQNDSIVDTLSQTRFFGESIEYANEDVTVYKYTDYFTKSEQIVGTFHIDSSGTFDYTFPIDQTQEIYMYLGIYQCFLFVEPDSSYHILLPPRQDRTLAHELNPYFQHESLSLGIVDPSANDLNMLLFEFNSQFETFITNNFQGIYMFRDKRVVDVLEHKLDSIYAYVENDYFNAYKEYRIYTLRFMAYQRNRIAVTRKYYLDKEAHYYNPTYINLFQLLWKDYLTNNYMKDMGVDMRQSIIYGKSPTMFKQRLEQHMALRNDTLKELILLQCLQDCYRLPEIFPQRTVYQTLDSLILLTKIPEHRIIATNIKKKQRRLQVGDPAPDFTLYNKDSIPIILSQQKGKYVYLTFCRSENFACIQDYKIMSEMNRKTRKHLHIITVSNEKDFESFETFARTNYRQYPWTFVYGGDHPEVTDAYLIKGTPSYVLINPEGKIELIQAPTPIDDFQQKFADIVIQRRNEAIERKRREHQKHLW